MTRIPSFHVFILTCTWWPFPRLWGQWYSVCCQNRAESGSQCACSENQTSGFPVPESWKQKWVDILI
jgi:hypothetical protein